MSEQRSVEQCIVINFLIGENGPTAEIHHRLQQHGPVCLSGVSASERVESVWRMNRMIIGCEHPSPSQTLIVDTPPTKSLF
jgi:hypothetical protein